MSAPDLNSRPSVIGIQREGVVRIELFVPLRIHWLVFGCITLDRDYVITGLIAFGYLSDAFFYSLRENYKVKKKEKKKKKKKLFLVWTRNKQKLVHGGPQRENRDG
jgi:hypothetical protein